MIFCVSGFSGVRSGCSVVKEGKLIVMLRGIGKAESSHRREVLGSRYMDLCMDVGNRGCTSRAEVLRGRTRDVTRHSPPLKPSNPFRAGF